MPIENWRRQPNWFEENNHFGIDLPKTQELLRTLFNHGRVADYSDQLMYRMYPLLRASVDGVSEARFDIEALICAFLFDRLGTSGGTMRRDDPNLRRFLTLIASGELTLADFKA